MENKYFFFECWPYYECFRSLAGKPTGKRPLGRPRCRCKDNIRMDLEWYQCGELDCFVSAYGLLESPCECGFEVPGSINHGVS